MIGCCSQCHSLAALPFIGPLEGQLIAPVREQVIGNVELESLVQTTDGESLADLGELDMELCGGNIDSTTRMKVRVGVS
jgi:hypothetical protein